MPPLAAILIYAVAAAAQWQGHGSRARHAALDAALTAYPEIHARETEKLKNGDPSARFVMARVTNGLGNRNYGIIASFALALYQRAALYVHWPEQHCDGFADAEGVEQATPARASSPRDAPRRGPTFRDSSSTTASRRTRDGRRSTTPTRTTGPSRSVPGCTSELTIKFYVRRRRPTRTKKPLNPCVWR